MYKKEYINPFNQIMHIYIFALILTLAFIMPCQKSYAQNIIELKNDTYSINISPHSYITIDTERNLTSDIVNTRHDNNLKGKINNTDVINLGTNSTPSWILFSVINKSNISDWVINFGDALDGRMGMVGKIHIINYTTKKYITYPSQENNGSVSPFIKTAYPIRVAPLKQNTFMMYIENDNGLPLILAPQIMPKNTYINQALNGSISNTIALLLFIGIISFFLFSYYIERNNASLALAAHYILLGLFFSNINDNFIATGFVGGRILLLIYITSLIPIFAATKFFIKITYDERPMENKAIMGIALLTNVIALLYLIIFGISYAGFIILTVITCLSFIALIVISIFTSARTKLVTYIYCAALSLIAISFLVLSFTALNIITASSFTVCLFWFLQIPIAACFIASNLKSISNMKIRIKKNLLYQKHKEESQAKLQKSKESADHVRLLRVIERERELMAELREREAERTEEMRISKEIADKANQAKSAFLAVVSHEIRTPMNGVVGMVQLLQDTALTKTQHNYIDTIYKSSETMMALLNDILDFEKIEHGGMELENIDFDLHQLANDIVVLMSGHAAQKNILIKTEIDPRVPKIVSGDPTRIRQVILNLINNAIKFTNKGNVLLEIKKLTDENNSLINFAIKDTGIGISKEAIRKLFTPFQQAETSTSRKYGGTGLGLAISNKLIEAMGSKIIVTSEENVGTIFQFEIKLETKLEAKPSSALMDSNKIDNYINKNKKSARPMKILVVDDNEMNRRVLDGFLTKDGHDLSMAANGLEALEVCYNNELELVLMDIQMDGMSGIEVTQKLRSDPNQKISRIPIIALTGHTSLEDIERFFAVGINGFIGKPIDSNKLNEVIYNASIGKFENELPEETEINLNNIETNLELDKREEFTKEITVKKQAENPIINKETDIELNNNDNNSKDFPDIKKEKNDLSMVQLKPLKKDDEELTEIQKYLMGKNSQNTPPQIQEPITNEAPPTVQQQTQIDTNATKQTVPENVNIEDIIDIDMLKSLIDALGDKQFSSLLEGFMDKSEEIINNIDTIIEEDNIPSLGARAHELKGMSGNFGMKHISSIAGEVEKYSKTSEKDKAISYAKKLNAANEDTKAAFKKWIENS